MEAQLLECLEALSSAGDDERARLRKVSRTVGYEELPKSWKALVKVAAAKIGLKEFEENPLGPRKGTRRGGRRKRRQEADPSDLIVADSDEGNPAFKLCRAILVQRKSDIEEEGLDQIRNMCEKGIHPAWERLAREAPVFAELSRFPVKEQTGNELGVEDWVAHANFDPLDHASLVHWLKLDPPFAMSSKQRKGLLMLRREYASKVDARRVRKLIEEVQGTNSSAGFLVGILKSSLGDDCSEEFDLASSKNELREISNLHKILSGFRTGSLPSPVSSWLSDERSGQLASAIRLEAWKSATTEDLALDLEELESGGLLLDENESPWPTKLTFKVAAGMIDGDRLEEAKRLILTRPIEPSDALALATKFADEDITLSNFIEDCAKKIHLDGLQALLRNPSQPVRTRAAVAKELIFRKEILTDLTLLSDVLTEGNEIDLLSEVLASQNAITHPMRGLLVWHLLPASAGMKKMASLSKLRQDSIESLKTMDDECLSETAIALIALMNGFPHDPGVLHDKLGSSGIKALNQARRALLEEGTGMIKHNSIDQLLTTADTADFSPLERSLFESLITSLKLNRARIELQMDDESKFTSATESISSIVEHERLSTQVVISISEIVEEYKLSLPSLEDWYRLNAPDTEGSQITRAGIAINRGDYLNAGRCYLEAARRSQGFERTTSLRRMALIQFAHAKAWKQAVELIRSNNALMAAVTKKFQLFLNVCSEYDRGKSNVGTDLVLDYASRFDKDERDEVLNALRTYPDEMGLPSEPFEGRVKAALKRMDRPGRKTEDRLERRLKEELHKGRDVLEISLIAQEQAEKKPIAGLRMFQSAINHGGFDEEGVRRIRRSQRSMFTTLESQIPIKNRKTFNIASLKPLVIVDTNILIQAFKDELARKGSSDGLGYLEWSMERAFQWALRKHGDSGSIKPYIPNSVMSEFKNRTKNAKTCKRLFDGEYQDPVLWSSIKDNDIEQIQADIIGIFNRVDLNFEQSQEIKDEMNGFLASHEDIFEQIDENKRLRRDDEPSRYVINGRAIYPEYGDREIMIDAASLATYTSRHTSKLRDVGSIVIATRDSDFRMIRRSLEETYGFVVIENAEQISRLLGL